MCIAARRSRNNQNPFTYKAHVKSWSSSNHYDIRNWDSIIFNYIYPINITYTDAFLNQ